MTATDSAKILSNNLNALAVHAASEALDADTRAHYLINWGDTFSRLKCTFAPWLTLERDALDNVASLFGQLIQNLVRTKPDRSVPRNFPEKLHLSAAYKNGA